jgi:chemotaxis protein methyltransferase CheR
MNNDAILTFFAKYIEKELGIVYSEANYYQLEHRLNEIRSKLGLSTLDDLYIKAQTEIGGSFKNLLLDLATNNETSFFRDPNIFKAFSAKVLQDKLDNNDNKLSMWSAASSSGQEIYSLLMEIDQFQENKLFYFDLSFLATDVSDTILKRARDGIYSNLEVHRGLSDSHLKRYFSPIGSDSWEFTHSLRRQIAFTKLNLLDTWAYTGPYDVIFCRNVLIYQSVENKIKILNELAKKIKPNGYLILGAAESLFGLSSEFNQIAESSAILYQKKA